MTSILVIDFAGHGFQMDLSRALARRGHEVTHSYCSTNLTPHGDLSSGAGVEVVPIGSGNQFEKYRPGRRVGSELVYGLRTSRLAWRTRPEAVLTSNVPLISLFLISVVARIRGTRWVLWLQDIQAGLATPSLTGPSRLLAGMLRRLERWLIRSADEVVAISQDFADEIRLARAVDPTIIENWAVLQDLPVLHKQNAWSRKHEIDLTKPVFLYAGTLGRKHPPELLMALAEELDGAAQLIVASEGEGARSLAHELERRAMTNVTLLPFQPHERLAEMLASADVLVAVLHDSAGSFSTPSKVLSYLCACRALLVAMPEANRSRSLVAEEAEAGVAADPTPEAIRKAAADLMSRRGDWAHYGERARLYAESAFDVDVKASQFEELLLPQAASPSSKDRN